jgi:hypothetical protein
VPTKGKHKPRKIKKKNEQQGKVIDKAKGTNNEKGYEQ